MGSKLCENIQIYRSNVSYRSGDLGWGPKIGRTRFPALYDIPCNWSLVLAVSIGNVIASATQLAMPPKKKGLRSFGLNSLKKVMALWPFTIV